jgi:predicted Zn-dependent protease
MRAANLDFFGEVIVDLGLQLAFVASVNGYGRALEGEADRGGFAKLEAAGYDLRQAPVVYEKLYEERGDSRRAEAFFFGSHPRLTERIEDSKGYLARRAAAAPPSTPRDPTIFEKRIRPVVRADARLNLEAGRLALAEEELAKVKLWMPGDPEIPWLEGRLRLKQAAAEQDPERRRELRAQAAVALHAVIRQDVDRPAPHRELGLLLFEDGDRKGACRELGHYLELDPDAEDAEEIGDHVQELRRDGDCA